VVALLASVSLLLSVSVLLRGEGREKGPSGDHGDISRISAAGGQGNARDHGQPVTVAEQEAAQRLIDDTEAGAARFEYFEVARTEGYQQMRGKRGKQPGPSRPLHFLNKEYAEDGRVLDLERPEGLMYIETGDGETDLIGVMYVASRDEGPTAGGELTQWHTHERLCIGYEEAGSAVVSLKLVGCQESSSPASDLEMMHVWLFDHPGGSFSPDLVPVDV
jgi:hypothetical protein